MPLSWLRSELDGTVSNLPRFSMVVMEKSLRYLPMGLKCGPRADLRPVLRQSMLVERLEPLYQEFTAYTGALFDHGIVQLDACTHARVYCVRIGRASVARKTRISVQCAFRSREV